MKTGPTDEKKVTKKRALHCVQSNKTKDKTPTTFVDNSAYQNKCPQTLMTASLAVSKQMLHSKFALGDD